MRNPIMSLAAAAIAFPAVTLGQGTAPPRFMDSDGVRIRYLVQGEGPPVLLVHGLALGVELGWSGPILDSLASRYRVIALDLRGHGLSDKPRDAGAYGSRMVQDLVNLLDHLGIERAHVVGYSLGAAITLKLLTTHPDRVSSAVIGGIGWSPPGEPRPPVIAEWMTRLERAARDSTSVFDALRQPDWPEFPPAVVAMVNRNDPLVLASVIRADDELRVPESALRSNRIPTMSVVGSGDDLARPRLEPMTRVMANLQTVVLEGADHMTATRHPLFLPTILAFLQSQPRSEPSGQS